jgi:hypothetical protein
MPTAMVSGHLDLTWEEFEEHYAPKLKLAIARGDSFVIGDAPGADTMAQKYIYSVRSWFKVNVTIYYNAQWSGPRNNVGRWNAIGRGKRPSDKDAAMTEASDYDIAWVRPGKEKSGTAANLRRRVIFTGDNNA